LEWRKRMQRKQLIIAGVTLLLLLLAGSTVLVFRPWEGPKVSPTQSGPGITQIGPVKAEPGDTVVMLTWEAVEGARGYFVYRDGGNSPLTLAPIKETNFEDIGLSNGRTYDYEVAAVDAAGIPGKRMTKVEVAPRAR
jgi:hypothetical protein